MDAALSDHIPASRDRSSRDCSWGVRVVNIIVLLSVCACVPALRKSAPAATHHVGRTPTVTPRGTSDHDLSDAEKDMLFRGFLRWRATQRLVEPRDADQSRSLGDVGEAKEPDQRTAPDAGPNTIP
jgi:hypothetical protein